MNFIIGMTKYFRNLRFFKILYGYSALFLCIYIHFRRCCTHFYLCCTCCMGMQHVNHVNHVAYVAHEWTIDELHMQHVHMLHATYSPIFSIVAHSSNGHACVKLCVDAYFDAKCGHADCVKLCVENFCVNA